MMCDDDHLWPKVFLPPPNVLNRNTRMKPEKPTMNVMFENNFKEILDKTVGTRFAAKRERSLAYEAVKGLVMPVVCNQLKEYDIVLDSIRDFPGDNGPWPLTYNFNTVINNEVRHCSIVFHCHPNKNNPSTNVLEIWIDGKNDLIVTIDKISGDDISKGVLELFNTFENFLDCFKSPVITARKY